MWVEPKTSWVATDYYNLSDYDRIRNNIEWLKQLADNVVNIPTVITKSYKYSVPTLTPMTAKTHHDIPFAAVLNAIENNFAAINTNTHDLTDTRNVFVGNGVFITYNQLNDLESKILLLHDWLLNDMTPPSNLGFTLANSVSQKGIRV